MPIVRAFQIEGAKSWFWSHDHDPPHLHVKRSGEWEVRVYFLLPTSDMIELRWAKRGLSKKVIKEIASLASVHRADLLKQWDEIQGCE